jgi:dTMP kinase
VSRYIAFEGGDAAGKSTQARRLAAELDAVLTLEPGGTRIGRALRAVLLDPANSELHPRTESLLYAADRAQHHAEVIAPALAAGRNVVSDRSAYSSLAYQAFGRGFGLDDIHRFSDWALQGCWPDLVVLLTVDPSVATARLGSQLDRLEAAGDEFHRRVADGFVALASREPERFVVLPAGGGIDEVAAAVRSAVRERLGL